MPDIERTILEAIFGAEYVGWKNERSGDAETISPVPGYLLLALPGVTLPTLRGGLRGLTTLGLVDARPLVNLPGARWIIGDRRLEAWWQPIRGGLRFGVRGAVEYSRVTVKPLAELTGEEARAYTLTATGLAAVRGTAPADGEAKPPKPKNHATRRRSGPRPPTARQLEAYTLVEVRGLPPAQAAEQLSITRQAVERLVDAARKKLARERAGRSVSAQALPKNT